MGAHDARKHRWNPADALTLTRMAASVLLIFLPLRSGAFLAVYTLAGLTDALDGWLARRMGTDGDFGARLDSAADVLFFGVLLLRLAPAVWRRLPRALWCVVAVILLVRLGTYAAAVRRRRFTARHTRMNRLTGAAVFLLPYVFAVSGGVRYSWAVCALALAAALEEAFLAGREAAAEAGE